MTDTLQLDSPQLAAIKSDSRFAYDRELIGGSENLLEWISNVISRWLADSFDIVMDQDIVTYILVGVGILVILFLTWLFLRYRPKLFVRGGDSDALEYDVQEDTIYGVDFVGEIRKALANGDYRQAVRLVYLQTLLYLQNEERIDWQLSKTPVQYMHQVNQQPFTEMSQHFIRVRYGNFKATKELYEQMTVLQSQIIGSGQQLHNEDTKGGQL